MCNSWPGPCCIKTIVSLQLMVSLQTMVTTIATLLHSQSKSRNQWYLPDLKASKLMNCFVWNNQYFKKTAWNKHFLDVPEMFPIELCTKLPLVAMNCWTFISLLNWLLGVLRLFSDVLVRLLHFLKDWLEIHSKPPILYYGFKLYGPLFSKVYYLQVNW